MECIQIVYITVDRLIWHADEHAASAPGAVDKSCACHELCAAHISFACASIDALKSKWYQTLASRASCGDKADER